MNVNLWQLLRAGDVNQDTIVQDGDTIVIPAATHINPAEATALADASFSPATIKVSMVGEVKNPGVDIDPAAGVALATLIKAAAHGQIDQEALILLHITGGGKFTSHYSGLNLLFEHHTIRVIYETVTRNIGGTRPLSIRRVFENNL